MIVSRDFMGEFLAETVSRQPAPPRHVEVSSLVLAMLRRGYWQLIGLGAVFILLERYVSGNQLSAFGLVIVLGGLFIWGLVFRDGYRYYRAARFGRLAEAHILAVKTGHRDYTDSAWVKARVYLADEMFDASFSFARSWARELTEGSRLYVLVNPTKPQVMFTVART
jgi:hypothetical protein